MADQMLLHATCIAIGERGVLLLGAPGSGKSDLALRLIDMPGHGTGEALMNAKLVSDDQVTILRDGDQLFASPPQAIAGGLEIRGQGIVSLSHRAQVRLYLAVKLTAAADIDRMPEPDKFELLGLSLPLVKIDPRTASAAARVRAALLAI